MSSDPNKPRLTFAFVAAALAGENLDFERYCRRAAFRDEFNSLVTMPQKWNFFGKYYAEFLPDIMARSEQHVRGWVNPNYIDWDRHFSPIEAVAWDCIRCKYGTPLYPQFPVLDYFIDFANPFVKVGIELDGKAFHDIKRDQERDQRLKQLGWQIFRIPGSDCFRPFMDPGALAERGCESYERLWRMKVEDWLNLTCDGVIQAIDLAYFQTPEQRTECRFLKTAFESLQRHTLTYFKAPAILPNEDEGQDNPDF